MSKSNDDGTGCAVAIFIVCFAIGIGSLFGLAWGFLSVAAIMFLLLLVGA